MIFGTAAVAMLALTFGSASAFAATQHWYGVNEGPRLAEGSSTEVVGEGGTSTLKFNVIGAVLEIQCNSTKVAGTIENPAGSANGALSGAKMTLSGCSVTTPTGGVCTVPASIASNLLRGEATLAGKNPSIKFEPESGSSFATFTVGGSSCSNVLKGTKTLTGGPVAEFRGSGNEYEVTRSGPSTLKFGGQTVEMSSSFRLNSNSGQTVAIGTDTEPAGEHWFVGGEQTKPAYAKLSEGSTVPYASVPKSTTLGISATIAGVKFKMDCGGSAEGSVENPAGGSAGTATATMTFAGCSVSEPAGVCVVGSPVVSSPLSGLAGETGGLPSVTLSLSGKTTIASFTVAGESCPAALKGSKALTGSGLIGAPNASGALVFGPSLNGGLKYGGQTATVSAQTKPVISTGERLTLAP